MHLVENPAARELQACFAGFGFYLFRRQARLELSVGQTDIRLLQFDRLTLPSPCHDKIIRRGRDARGNPQRSDVVGNLTVRRGRDRRTLLDASVPRRLSLRRVYISGPGIAIQPASLEARKSSEGSPVMISANAALSGSYDYGEVARSVFIAIAASYAALDLAGRVTAASGRLRLAWLTGGALAMGIGIWEMHFKGMMAFHLPVPILYHWPTVLASLALAILASAIALYVTSLQKMGLYEALTGSACMAAGIVGLHYACMAAMRLPAVVRYSSLLVICSILLAILFSWIALLMAFGLREETRWIVPRRVSSAVVMGAAVSAMHYTGMAAATFIAAPSPDLTFAVSISPLGNNGIGTVTLLVITVAMVTSSVDRRAGGEAAAALQEAQDKLAHVTRIHVMGELVAAIAHEVNQPLTAIITNANFCLRQLKNTDPNLEELQAAITEIVSDGSRAGAVISRIRGLLVKGTPHRRELDINEIIQQVSILLRNVLVQNRVYLRTDLAADLPPVQGDSVQLQQVLINLIMNAVEAMRMSSETRRKLWIRSAKKADGVLVQVEDSGPGIGPGLADSIFEPFYTTKEEGVGMGLSISRSIVESHGGQLSLVPASRGGLFQFSLPASDTSQEQE